MNVVICSAQDQEAARLGIPAVHALQKRPQNPFARAWVHRAEYRLPEGYTAIEKEDGQSGIYNAAGHRCPLIDSVYSGSAEGRPIIIDGDLPAGKQVIYLHKVCDLTFELLKKIGGM